MSDNSVALAVDLGTTTIAASLVDQASGKRLASGGCLNPQREFGADVITRLSAAEDVPEQRHRMAELVNAELESLAMQLLEEVGMHPDSLRRVAIAGNPAMEHLLLDLPVASLARIPYRPLFSEGRNVCITELGWKLACDAYIFPLPGGFVGGDLVAFLYGQISSDSQLLPHHARLYLDLGTNAEIALVSGDTVFATSAAAGPAFEAGNLSCGMPGLPGAVSNVAINGDRVTIDTIADAHPKGICGTGVLSLMAELLRSGVMERTGRLKTPAEITSNLAGRIVEHSGIPAFLVYRDAGGELFLTQHDIRQVQLAKGAVRAGIEVLLDRAGIRYEALQELVLTGSFGALLRPELLKIAGIVPDDVVEHLRPVRDGALEGVERMLSASDGMGEVETVARKIKVFPLSGTPAFEKIFLEQIDFPAVRQ